jgi:hypothetical protein
VTPDRLTRLDAEQRALCLGARTVLSGSGRDDLAATIGAGLDWERLWDLAHLHEVVPVLGASVLAAGGDKVPATWRQRVIKRRHVTLRANGHLADTLVEVLAGLEAAGVPAMPVKGLVIADQLYGDLGARPCADLDVLVQPADLPRARVVLQAVGFAQRVVPRYKALVHQFHDPAWGRGAGADHVRLELHWALWADSERRLGTGGLWDRSVPGTLLDQPIRTLSIEDTLLHLAIHRTRSALRLRWVADVAELLRRHSATLDWDAYLDRASRAGARTSSWVVLTLAADLLDGPVPPMVLHDLAVGRPKRALLERTCGIDALFRGAATGDVKQQPHLTLRAFEEDGPGRIARVLGGSAVRPIREALHDAGLVRVRRPLT